MVGASGTNQRRFDEDVNLPLIKVVVLGAPAVGKTSVVRVSSLSFSSVHIVTFCQKLVWINIKRQVSLIALVRKKQSSFE